MATRLCFVIGRMGEHQARLDTLAYEVLEPLLKPLGYEVLTPNEPGMGKVMNHVVKRLEQAALVVADLTEANPNVLYELAIRHSLGTPCVMVTETPQKIPFDIRAYRYITIHLEDIAATQATLQPIVAEAHQEVVGFRENSNPVTDFFKAPLTNISPSAGLALGYFQNYVKPAVEKMMAFTPDMSAHQFDIEIDQGAEGKFSFGKTLEGRADLKLYLVLPQHIESARPDSLNELRGRLLKPSVIQSQPRPFTGYARLFPDSYQLVDIPTTMAVIEASLTRWLGGERAYNSPEWRRLEAQEINRFEDELNRWINGMDRAFKRRVAVLRYFTDTTDERLTWLHALWG